MLTSWRLGAGNGRPAHCVRARNLSCTGICMCAVHRSSRPARPASLPRFRSRWRKRPVASTPPRKKKGKKRKRYLPPVSTSHHTRPSSHVPAHPAGGSACAPSTSARCLQLGRHALRRVRPSARGSAPCWMGVESGPAEKQTGGWERLRPYGTQAAASEVVAHGCCVSIPQPARGRQQPVRVVARAGEDGPLCSWFLPPVT